ncbi:flagellar filament capping protein FliD [Candidatus Blastococcus massiliensis]|uniref:flagellar filament capping protein FliD n=1 Tax=Candidatus Blastococcus massiliensis TaxID=1470358 RepID=UPI0004B6DA0F|nr:flagellar filament capping protein FliD [Candidatus Blastococcus massiliensis]
MSMSVDGLISGMDTTALISGLIQAEAAPQTALKSRMSDAEKAASAYRTVNTTFLAVTAAAEAALKAESWVPAKATSSASSVAVSATSGAPTGALSFTVDQLAAAHGMVRHDAAWTADTSAFSASATTLTIKGLDGSTRGTPLDISATTSLKDVAATINAGDYGVTASVIQIDAGKFSLQLTSKKTGAANEFTLEGGGTFDVTTQAQNAKLTIGTTNKYSVSSDTNTFAAVLPGATITVSKLETDQVTVGVASDPNAVAGKVSTLIDAVNSALSTTRSYTSSAKGSTAALKGDYAVTSLAGRLLDAVSGAIGADGSPARIGIELTRDGKITFDKAKFVAALEADPTLAKRMVAGTPASTGPDGVVGGGDDVAAVTGLAGRLLDVSKAASNSTTGTLVAMADGQDSQVKDIKARIEAWDLRLAKRKETLTRQFTAMETALSGLKSQSTWLAGQINSLPSYR